MCYNIVTMMKHSILYLFLPVLGVLSLVSCEKHEGNDNCRVSLYIDTDLSQTEILSKAAPPEDMVFSVKIKDQTGQEVYSFPDHREMPQTVTLPVGTYTATAVTNRDNATAAFESPVYSGETVFTTRVNATTGVKITCSHACVKVVVGYTDALKELLSEYKTVVTTGTDEGTLVFEGDETRAGYFQPGILTYTLQAETKQGETYTATRTMDTALKGADFLHIVFDVKDDTAEGSGSTTGFAFGIVVDETLNDIHHQVNIAMDKGTPPTITPDNFNPDETIAVYNPVKVPVVLDVAAETGLFGLCLKFQSDLGTVYGFDNLVDLLHVDEVTAQALRNAGINWSVNETATGARIDLTEATANLTYDENVPVDHAVELTVVDNHRQFVSQTLNFKVYSKIHKAVNAQLFASEQEGMDKVVLTGRYVTETVPEGMGLIYKETGASDWNTVTADRLSIDLQTKQCTYTVDLPQNVDYVFTTALIEDGAVSEQGDMVIHFATQPVLTVPNLNFDSWHTSGSTQYPNASGGNSFWATGNEGVTGFPVNKDSNTIPVEDDVISGKAAKMTSIEVPVVNFAAGNLFTGTYKTNITNPASSVQFGREFTGRPTHLTGYYKYQPADYNGGKDYCHIYIKLENRGETTTTVGYVEIKDNRTMTQYEPFSLKVEYTSDLPVTHITLVATSSADGGNFKGGVGSTLWVDEFDLLYLYDE